MSNDPTLNHGENNARAKRTHRRKIWVGVGIAVALVMACAVVLALTLMGSHDPERKASEEDSMTATSAEALTQELRKIGWRCFEPELSVQQTRCYLWRDKGRKERPTLGTLTLTYANPDHIATSNLRVDFGDDDMRKASYALGETLLNGNGKALSSESKTFNNAAITGKVEVGYTDKTIVLRNQNVSQPTKEVKGPKLPSTKSVVRVLENDKDFDCQSRSTSVFCQRTDKHGLEIHVANFPLGDSSLGRWNLTVHASDHSRPVTISQGVKALSQIAVDTRMTDNDGVDFYNDNLGDGQQGDFAGYHTSISFDGPRDGKLRRSDSLQISIDAIG